MLRQAVEYLRERGVARPEMAVMLGSGLGGIAARLHEWLTIPFSEIPGWPTPTVPGHAGQLRWGSLNSRPAVLLAGRVHLHEGYSPAEVVFGVRVLGQLGVRTLVVTNASGAVSPTLFPGQLALISDHINLLGANPLIGRSQEANAPRFLDMTDAYSPRLRNLAREAAGDVGVELAEGVYAAVPGPSYETPAEVRYLRTIGVDLVGMSTVLEVIAARQLDIEVLGLSCVTNRAAGLSASKLSHEEVLVAGRAAEGAMSRLLVSLAGKL